VEEDRVHYLARAGWKSERNIRNAQDGAHVGQRLFNQTNAFHSFDCTADVILVARAAGKHERIEDDLFRCQAVLFREQLVGAPGNGQLALAREGLCLDGILIDASDDDGGAIFMRNRHGALRSEEHTSELQSPYDLVCRLLLEK